MVFKNYSFQNNAVNKLYDSYISSMYGNSSLDSTILQAPTGSGKTAILIKLMDRIVQDNDSQKISFVWLTPGAGGLEEQSWSKTSSNALFVKPFFLMDSLSNGFQKNSVTFLNWELVNNRNNIALRDGERTNLPEAINYAKESGIKFVLIIDEEHRNQTDKSRHIIDMFNPKMIFKASATPIDDKYAKHVIVTEDDVISAGLITQNVILNDQFNGVGSETELQSSTDEDFLDAADEKRIQIKNAYEKLNSKINPLVLIQFPDEKKSDREVANKIDTVKNYLINELGQNEDEIAVWLSGKQSNVEYISDNNSKVNYLLMKQAISTGWDAPRAKILVKLRLNTSKSFTIQTIGRIRRMPEQHYYDDDVLNNSYVYSNDSKYVYEIIKNGAGFGIKQMSLRDEVSPDIFNIDSRKLNKHVFKDVSEVTRVLRKEFVKEFNLNDDAEFNKKQLEKYNWIFGREIYSTIQTGKVSKLEDLATETKTLTTTITITNTADWGYRYDAVMELIKPYLHVGEELSSIRAIISDLFAFGEPGSDVKPILKLKPKDRYAFIINNAPLLRDVIKRMDSHYYFNEQLSLLKNDYFSYIPFILPVRDGYNDDGETGSLLEKNVYSGYTTANWSKQSNPEIMLEKYLNSSDETKWFYRSKDHGYKYFSISYNAGTREFFPDYLVKDLKENTYILEVKGAEGQNIDSYAQSKFNALKSYVDNHCDDNVKFAFIRPSLEHKDLLMYNDSVWDEQVDGSKYWKPISELFN